MRAIRSILVLLAMSAPCVPACAQHVYKCTVDGKVTYGESVCTAGATTEVSVPTVPASDPARRDELNAQKALVAGLGKDRHKREAIEDRRQARADQRAATLRKKCAPLKLRKRWADEDLANATRHSAQAMALKARRSAQMVALECPP